MVVRESFYLRSQHSGPGFVPTEVHDEVGADVPDVVRVRGERCEDVEQMFGVHVLRCDPLRFCESWLAGFEFNP